MGPTVGVEDFGEELDCRRLLWVLLGEHQLQLKHSALLHTPPPTQHSARAHTQSAPPALHDADATWLLSSTWLTQGVPSGPKMHARQE